MKGIVIKKGRTVSSIFTEELKIVRVPTREEYVIGKEGEYDKVLPPIGGKLGIFGVLLLIACAIIVGIAVRFTKNIPITDNSLAMVISVEGTIGFEIRTNVDGLVLKAYGTNEEGIELFEELELEPENRYAQDVLKKVFEEVSANDNPDIKSVPIFVTVVSNASGATMSKVNKEFADWRIRTGRRMLVIRSDDFTIVDDAAFKGESVNFNLLVSFMADNDYEAPLEDATTKDLLGALALFDENAKPDYTVYGRISEFASNYVAEPEEYREEKKTIN